MMGFTVTRISDKMGWVTDESKVIKLSHTHVVPKTGYDKRNRISEFLRRFSPFDSWLSTSV